MSKSESKELRVCSEWRKKFGLFDDLAVKVSWGQDWMNVSMSHREGRHFDLSVSKDELIQHGFTCWDTAEQAARIIIDTLEQGSVDPFNHRRVLFLEQVYNDDHENETKLDSSWQQIKPDLLSALSIDNDDDHPPSSILSNHTIALKLSIVDYCGRKKPFRYLLEMKDVILPIKVMSEKSKIAPAPASPQLSALAKPFVMSEETKEEENVIMNNNRINVYHSSSVTEDGFYMKWDTTHKNDFIVWDESKSRMMINQDCIVKISGVIAVSESKSKVLSCAVEMNGNPAVYSVGQIQSQSEIKHPSGPSPMISLPFCYAFSAKKSDCCRIFLHGNVFQCPTYNVLIVEILS